MILLYFRYFTMTGLNRKYHVNYFNRKLLNFKHTRISLDINYSLLSNHLHFHWFNVLLSAFVLPMHSFCIIFLSSPRLSFFPILFPPSCPLFHFSLPAQCLSLSGCTEPSLLSWNERGPCFLLFSFTLSLSSLLSITAAVPRLPNSHKYSGLEYTRLLSAQRSDMYITFRYPWYAHNTD